MTPRSVQSENGLRAETRSREAATLVGRQAEVRVLDEMLAAVERGATRLLQVAGEPGIGKTRLLDELSVRGEARGFVVVAGRAAELEEDLLFGVVVDTLDDYLSALGPKDLEPLRPDVVLELARLFPTLRTAGMPPRRLEQERYQTYRAVRMLLDLIATWRPLVMVLDDLHWADRGSLELLSYLMRHPPRGRVLLAMAFRPAQVSAELASVLQAVTLRGEAERLDLLPLSHEESLKLTGSRGDQDWSEVLWRESGGNPFFLQELLRAQGRPSIVRSPAAALGGFGGVPPTVRHALAEELRSLSRAARSMLEHAAVVGDPFDIDVAGSAAGLSDGDGWAALDELLALEVVKITPQARRFRFRHPIVRRAVYESTSAGWRMGAHARTSTALAAQRAPASARAHHVERSAGVGDDEAVALLTEAAHEAAETAPAIAAHWYQAALHLLPEGTWEAQRRMELLVPMAGAFAAAGQLQECHATLLQALELPEARREARIRLVTSCANVEQLLGHRAQARARLLAALGELAPGSPQVATVRSELAVNAFLASEYDQASVWARQGLGAAGHDVADRPVRAIAAARAAIADTWIGRTDRAEPFLAEAAALVDQLDDSTLAADPELSFWLGSAENFMDRLDDAIRHFERGISLSRATGQGQRILQLMLGLQLALTERGRLADAAELGKATIEGARLSGSHQLLAFSLWQGCSVATGTGDLQAALRLGRQSFDMGEGMRHETIHAAGCSAFAGALLESGQADQCRTVLLEHLGGPSLPRLPVRARCFSYELLTASELALGRPGAASEWVRRAEYGASQLGLPLSTSSAHRSRALWLLASGEADAASEAALVAASEAAGAGACVDAARSRLLAGRALTVAGKRHQALGELERAADEFAACGAGGYRQKAVRELRRLGRRLAPQSNGTRANGILFSLSGLSGREREIAEMVSAGRTNREIADSLYLSVKTVERHLTHVYTKLGVRSRAAVAGLVGRQQGDVPRPETQNGAARPPAPSTSNGSSHNGSRA